MPYATDTERIFCGGDVTYIRVWFEIIRWIHVYFTVETLIITDRNWVVILS